MPTKYTSPYASTFKTGCKNGTPSSTVVWNISKKTNKPVNTIWNSLYKAGLCFRQKFNGTWVYWPSFPVKKNTTSSTTTQTTMWQSFVDWCVTSGCCTPNQLNNKSTSQKNFMNYCRTFFGKQFTTSGKTWTKRYPKTSRSRKSTTTYKTNWTNKHTSKRTTKTYKSNNPWSRTTTTRNYKFPTFKTRTTTRRYVRAA